MVSGGKIVPEQREDGTEETEIRNTGKKKREREISQRKGESDFEKRRQKVKMSPLDSQSIE